MKLSVLENSTLKDVTYYILTLWEKETYWGKTYLRAYMTEKGAKARINKLLATGKYSQIILRREDVWYRNENNEFSSSTPIKVFVESKYMINDRKEHRNEI